MSAKKSDLDKLVKLQNGMYCHFTEEHLVINDKMKLKSEQFTPNIDKTKNNKKVRLVINVIYTVFVVAFAVYTQFYPIALLMFVSLWDLRQLKRRQLPINKGKVIPYKNLTEIKLNRGKLGFNYMDVYIDNEGVKSFIPLQLYDSESTLNTAKYLADASGKLTSYPALEKFKISGPVIPLNEVSSYVLTEGQWHYTEHELFHKSRVDNYEYLRVLSYLFLVFGAIAIFTKAYMIGTQYSNFVDYVVILLLALLMLLPYKYASKALPNKFSKEELVEVIHKKSKDIIVLKNNKGFNYKIHLKKKFIKSDLKSMILNDGKNI